MIITIRKQNPLLIYSTINVKAKPRWLRVATHGRVRTGYQLPPERTPYQVCHTVPS